MQIIVRSLVLLALLIASSTRLWAEPQSTLFTNVNVFDGVQNKLFKADVLVVGNKIETVSREPLGVIQSTTMQLIDGGGRTLMPGMINSHTHLTHTFALGGVKGFEASTWEEIGAFATASAREQLMNGVYHGARHGRHGRRLQARYRQRADCRAKGLPGRGLYQPNRRPCRYTAAQPAQCRGHRYALQ